MYLVCRQIYCVSIVLGRIFYSLLCVFILLLSGGQQFSCFFIVVIFCGAFLGEIRFFVWKNAKKVLIPPFQTTKNFPNKNAVLFAFYRNVKFAYNLCTVSEKERVCRSQIISQNNNNNNNTNNRKQTKKCVVERSQHLSVREIDWKVYIPRFCIMRIYVFWKFFGALEKRNLRINEGIACCFSFFSNHLRRHGKQAQHAQRHTQRR